MLSGDRKSFRDYADDMPTSRFYIYWSYCTPLYENWIFDECFSELSTIFLCTEAMDINSGLIP